MGIDRIGAFKPINRDTASAGFEAQEKVEARQAPRNEKVDEVAKMYEKQFLGEMVRAMRQTVSFGAEKPSMAENIYRDQLDDQYTQSWSDQGGIGLANLIYDQMMERYFSQGAGKALKGSGEAIPLTDRDVSKVLRVKTAEGPGQVPLRIELKPDPTGAPAKIQAPWDGEVVSNARLEGGKTALTLKHGADLRSTLIFNGVAAGDAKPGTHFEKGRTIGILSPESHSFMWNINKSTPRSAGSLGGGLAESALGTGRESDNDAEL